MYHGYFLKLHYRFFKSTNFLIIVLSRLNIDNCKVWIYFAGVPTCNLSKPFSQQGFNFKSNIRYISKHWSSNIDLITFIITYNSIYCIGIYVIISL